VTTVRAAFRVIGIGTGLAFGIAVSIATEYLWAPVLTGGEDDLGVGVLVVYAYGLAVAAVVGLLALGSSLGIEAMWKNPNLRTPASVFIVAAAMVASATVAVYVLKVIY
jgi:hypothetical protein